MTETPIKYSTIKQRIVAGIIDYAIILSVTFALITYFGEPNGKGGQHLTGFSALLPTLFWFILTVLMEQLTGATIGNGIMGIKPVHEKGVNNKPDFFQSLKRHLLDPVDMTFFGIPGIISIKNTPKKQRLGDLWAKTVVIKAT